MADAELPVADTLSQVYREQSRRVFATLVRLLGDFDLAEEALQDAFTAAAAQWVERGIPDNPRAWLVSTGRFKAIDKIRRRKRFRDALPHLAVTLEGNGSTPFDQAEEEIGDDRLRLIFTCCHPALGSDARIALTLREVCGLTTEEIAGAFLSTSSTIAQRIVRAKRKIRDERIPYEIPGVRELPERLATVLHVIYLVFNEGYFATSGPAITRHDLSGEAIRLGRLLVELMPGPETEALLALMLLHESRRSARTNGDGEIVLLPDQDRSRWDHTMIAEGSALVEKSLRSTTTPGRYALQAAIAAVHAEAITPEETDWSEIVGLYDLLLRIERSPVVELNRAVAVSMRDGPEKALELVDAILARGELREYRLVHATRAELCRRLERPTEALESYKRALELTEQEPERRFIQQRIGKLKAVLRVR